MDDHGIICFGKISKTILELLANGQELRNDFVYFAICFIGNEMIRAGTKKKHYQWLWEMS